MVSPSGLKSNASGSSMGPMRSTSSSAATSMMSIAFPSPHAA